ncbi:hypothetical protein ACFP2T_16260 [Plantactinospora solaniradicis]|uniref:XRE family transcriptional regulator n=1 Tax=Plantactinospora solaniradicis TaxID=1723736 RepID=A0ABW1K7R0_9ACTN
MKEPGVEVNRAAWAEVVQELLRTSASNNKSELARKLDVSSKTIDRWLDQTYAVKEANVRRAARVFHLDLGELFQRVGYYSADEVRSLPATDPDADAVTLIKQSGLPEEVQQDLLAELRTMAQDDTARRRKFVDTALRLRHT